MHDQQCTPSGTESSRLADASVDGGNELQTPMGLLLICSHFRFERNFTQFYLKMFLEDIIQLFSGAGCGVCGVIHRELKLR
jgi:hydrogenase maturation factor